MRASLFTHPLRGRKQLVALLFLPLLCWTSCKRTDDPDPAQPALGNLHLSFSLRDAGTVDSALVMLRKSDDTLVTRMDVRSDSAVASLSKLAPGSWEMTVQLFTREPFRDNANQTFLHRSTHTVALSEATTRLVFASPVDTQTRPGTTAVTWQSFFLYRADSVTWLVPRDHCSGHFEMITTRYDYVYCDKIWERDERVVHSEAFEYTKESGEEPVTQKPDAFPSSAGRCGVDDWDTVASMLIAMDTATGQETVFYHTW